MNAACQIASTTGVEATITCKCGFKSLYMRVGSEGLTAVCIGCGERQRFELRSQDGSVITLHAVPRGAVPPGSLHAAKSSDYYPDSEEDPS